MSLFCTRFLMGRLEEAWPEYEWRWQDQNRVPAVFQKPVWKGESLAGRTILVHTEQGFGDSLQFVRYARLLHQRGARVVVTCEKSLVRLFRECPGIEQVVPKGTEVPPFDMHSPLMSLPGILRTGVTTIPADVPYLHPNQALAETWRRELQLLPGFKIGIAWQGSVHHKDDARRSVPLHQFASLAGLAGVRLFSLQVGPGTKQLDGASFSITPVGERFNDFADTAAAVSALDLVITVDTAIAHLAGALGIPVWVALPVAPDWRWLLDREDSPWYPTMRLFRQRTWGDWSEVFGRITGELQKWLSAAAQLITAHASAILSNTCCHSSSLRCRNSRMVGYHGLSSRSSSQRQSGANGRAIHTGMPSPPARCAKAESTVITRSRTLTEAAVSSKF